MRLIEHHRSSKTGKPCGNVFKNFRDKGLPGGTCVGMIIWAEGAAGAPAVIENGQFLIGGIDIAVCRDFFRS
jgi:glutamine amidotransferase PdxT